MTFSMMYAYSRELRAAALPRRGRARQGLAARARCPATAGSSSPTCARSCAFMWAHPGKQLLFMGSEFGQEREWAEARSLDWWLLDHPDHRGVQHAGRATSTGVYRRHPALWTPRHRPGGLPAGSTPTTPAATSFSFLRCGADGSALACVANFAGDPARGLPARPARTPARWGEVLNTDADVYGGSGVGNIGARRGDRRSRGTASPPRRRCACRRSAPSGCTIPAPPPPLKPTLGGDHAVTAPDAELEEDRGEVPTGALARAGGPGDPLVVAADHVEQLEQVLARRGRGRRRSVRRTSRSAGRTRPRRAPPSRSRSATRVWAATSSGCAGGRGADGSPRRGRWVRRSSSTCASPASRRRRPGSASSAAVGRGRGVEVAALDGVVGLVVSGGSPPRAPRLLRRRRPGAATRAGHPVRRRDPQQLVEDRRTCGSGSAPWNSGTGWPFMTAKTVGMLCTWKAWPAAGWRRRRSWPGPSARRPLARAARAPG